MIKWLFISDDDAVETVEAEDLISDVEMYLNNHKDYPRAIIRSRA